MPAKASIHPWEKNSNSLDEDSDIDFPDPFLGKVFKLFAIAIRNGLMQFHCLT